MKTILLPEVRLANVSLRSAVDTLKQLSQQHDRRSPKGDRGINLILRSPEDDAPGFLGLSGPATPVDPAAPNLDARPADYNAPLLETTPLITYAATKVTVQEVVAAIARLAGYHVDVQPYFVSIQKDAPPEQLFTREWKIPPDAMERMRTSPQAEAEKRTGIADRERAKAWLTGSGPTFNGQASSVYIVRSSRLIVRDTEENLREIDKRIAAYWREHAAAEKARKAKRR
jgi:general secretion pathway protein D